ncbi:hypothetical protein ABK040_006965 [Willaertia magna]
MSLLTDLPLEVIFEITGFIPVQDIFNFLLISKEYYQFIEYDIFWKSLLKFYLLGEIRNCKEILDELILDKDLLQEFFKVNSLENKANKNTKKKKFNLNQFNKENLLSITMNVRLLQNFIEFYKHNIVQLNSLNRNSFKRFLLEDLQHFKENNVNNEDNIDINNVIFSKRFKHLLQQCIKCKWSVLLNCLSTDNINEQFQYIFIELFLNNNDITLTEIDKYFTKEEETQIVENDRNNLQYFLQLLKQIKNCWNLQNIIYFNFIPKLNLFIDQIIYSLLLQYNYNENTNEEMFQKLIEFNKKYNLKISIDSLLRYCRNNLMKASPKYLDFCLQNLNDNLYKNGRDYYLIVEIIKHIFPKELNIDDKFYKKLNYLLDIFITDNCDKKELYQSLTKVIYPRLNSLLISEEDNYEEIYNFLNNLRFIKYNMTVPINNDFFSLQYNFNNFTNLVKLNMISNEDLLKIFHGNLPYNGYNYLNQTLETKENFKNQLKLYLNYFINDLKFDIYGKDKNNNNIINSALHLSNFSIVTNLIKNCCNLQQIDYTKINFQDISYYIKKQLLYNIEDDNLYELKELEEIKLNTIKEFLSINNLNHFYFLDLIISGLPPYEKQVYIVSALKYLLLNMKLEFNMSITLQEYVNEMLNREDVLVLNNLIVSQRDTIINDFYNGTIDKNSDLFIYFVYKTIQDTIEQLENEKITQ